MHGAGVIQGGTCLPCAAPRSRQTARVTNQASAAATGLQVPRPLLGAWRRSMRLSGLLLRAGKPTYLAGPCCPAAWHRRRRPPACEALPGAGSASHVTSGRRARATHTEQPRAAAARTPSSCCGLQKRRPQAHAVQLPGRTQASAAPARPAPRGPPPPHLHQQHLTVSQLSLALP
jgi:hypothetical protein